nr:DUF397 domain-containing protein [Catenulispora pinisilvae]
MRRHAEAHPPTRPNGQYNRRRTSRRADEPTSRRARGSGSGETLTWHKASMSDSGGNCVQVARTTQGIAVRDSKNPDGPRLLFTDAEFTAFLHGARSGEFDGI